MTVRQRVTALLRLALFNSYYHERRAAWGKALELISRLGLQAEDLSLEEWTWYNQLALLFPTQGTSPPPGHDDQTASSAKDDDAGTQQTRQRTRVWQKDVVRDVADHIWSDLTCSFCGATFSYESYPGNQRRYCSPDCKEAATRIAAKYRARDRRRRRQPR